MSYIIGRLLKLSITCIVYLLKRPQCQRPQRVFSKIVGEFWQQMPKTLILPHKSGLGSLVIGRTYIAGPILPSALGAPQLPRFACCPTANLARPTQPLGIVGRDAPAHQSLSKNLRPQAHPTVQDKSVQRALQTMSKVCGGDRGDAGA